ncbi:MAG: hypothetical protein WBE37_28600 [Bryobacteraceae bacterium]
MFPLSVNCHPSEVRKKVCPEKSLPFPYQLMDVQFDLRSEGGNMYDSRDAQQELVTAFLTEVGGERLEGSGFEPDEPELGFAEPELAGAE